MRGLCVTSVSAAERPPTHPKGIGDPTEGEQEVRERERRGGERGRWRGKEREGGREERERERRERKKKKKKREREESVIRQRASYKKRSMSRRTIKSTLLAQLAALVGLARG